MIQNVIVAIIILAALAYVGYSVYRSLKPGPGPKSSCGGCTGCELKDLDKGCANPVSNSSSGTNNKAFQQNISGKN